MKSQLIDLRCFYCLPKGFNDFDCASQHLTQDEIVRVVGAFSELGVRRIRLTGGEPLVRKDVCQLSARLSGLPGAMPACWRNTRRN